MSGHADTIRRYLDASGCMDEPPPHDALDALLAENQRLEEELTTSYLRREADGLIAEIQRLREALERIDAYIASLAYPGPEAKRIAEAVREALAGDTE